ncbi:galactose mutarotase-like enzyme [Pedobacter sp. UYP30]|uniref:aldose 1-epimerase family protein n=1 Tax=Pedobacter sp. UYP30 TaxID=1756400 RepID=UPI0033947A3B
MITLENEHLKICVAEKGAELQNLISKETQIDYLWNADPKYWAKHSPVLFPIIGVLKDDSYFYNDKKYSLPRHGFARDHTFKILESGSHEASFLLSQSDETLKNYPFYFDLTITYKLLDDKLIVSYNVKNTGRDNLLFSLGAHPAFAVPNMPNTKYEDYYITFNEDIKLKHYDLVDGLVSDKMEEIVLSGHKLPLSHKLFKNDALVLKSLQSNCVSLLNTQNHHGLHFHFDEFPYFGIWAAPDAPFVCLEPWCGVADSTASNQQLTEKEGINVLASNQQWFRSWEVECF